MNRPDRILVLVTAAAGIVICLLAVAPPLVQFTVGTISAVLSIGLLLAARLRRMQPPTVQHELDRRRIADAQERAAADRLRSQHNVTALPTRPPANVVPFPTDRNAS